LDLAESDAMEGLLKAEITRRGGPMGLRALEFGSLDSKVLPISLDSGSLYASVSSPVKWEWRCQGYQGSSETLPDIE
jgi:hypothetical protein